MQRHPGLTRLTAVESAAHSRPQKVAGSAMNERPEATPSARPRRRLVLAAAGAAALGGGLWAWLRREADDGSLARVRAAGELRVGYAVEAPYALIATDGSVSGESPEVARTAATRLGLRTSWIKTPFERLLPELEARRFDLVAAGLFVNPKRAARVRFTRPTLRVRSAWLTLAGNPKGLSSYAALQRLDGVRVAALAGSVEHAALEELHLAPGRLVSVPDAQSGLAAVGSGAVDALALSLPTVRQMAAASGGRLDALPAQGSGVQDNLVALAVHHDDATLQAALDQVLADYVGSGAHRAMLQRFGLAAEDLPQGVDVR